MGALIIYTALYSVKSLRCFSHPAAEMFQLPLIVRPQSVSFIVFQQELALSHTAAASREVNGSAYGT